MPKDQKPPACQVAYYRGISVNPEGKLENNPENSPELDVV